MSQTNQQQPWWQWQGPYREFEKAARDAVANGKGYERDDIDNAVESLYAQHKGEPAWDEAYRRWHEWEEEC